MFRDTISGCIDQEHLWIQYPFWPPSNFGGYPNTRTTRMIGLSNGGMSFHGSTVISRVLDLGLGDAAYMLLDCFQLGQSRPVIGQLLKGVNTYQYISGLQGNVGISTKMGSTFSGF